MGYILLYNLKAIILRENGFNNSILSWGFLRESPFIFLFKEVIEMSEKMLNTRI
jgi:hypothetical protein